MTLMGHVEMAGMANKNVPFQFERKTIKRMDRSADFNI